MSTIQPKLVLLPENKLCQGRLLDFYGLYRTKLLTAEAAYATGIVHKRLAIDHLYHLWRTVFRTVSTSHTDVMVEYRL